ncbi:MAG: T9SS type A sorting domain-containing protein, partial [candidate division Zixibacteria bacterium]|nr:T9SS type A sorting domain-containing protein [candidate division Zixibacteria bacterium]
DPEAQTFLSDYLQVDYGGSFGQFLVAGEPGDEIGDGMYIFPLQAPGANNQTSKDILNPDGQADIVLRHNLTGWAYTDSVAAVKVQDGSFRVVTFGFGFEAINPEMDSYAGQSLSKPRAVMQKVLNWLRGYSDVEEREYESASLPEAVHLGQNYPNPFNPATSIQYTVDSRHKTLQTTLKIYNIKGQMVKTLVDEETIPGTHSVMWDGKDQEGNEVSSGIYFYRLKVGDQSEVKKMVLLK